MKKRPRKKTSHAQTISSKREDFVSINPRTKVRVVGVGGGGGNIVAEIAPRISRVDFVAANTDAQALKMLPARVKKMNFGLHVTRGLGCGMDAELGERAAREEKEKIKKLLHGYDVCIIVASLGGGTGSGSSSIFCQAAREAHALTIGVFTTPFVFEGKKREFLSNQALEKLRPLVNAYILIPNEKIFQVVDKETPLQESLSALNKRLADSIGGLIETMYSPGIINVDFADVKTMLEGRGKLSYLHSAMGSGMGGRASQALSRVTANPLSDYDIRGAERILFNIASDKGLKMQEVAEISSGIASFSPKAKIIFGVSMRSDLKDKIRITVLGVGCKEEKQAMRDSVSKKEKNPESKRSLVSRETNPVKKFKSEKPKKVIKPSLKEKPLKEQTLVRRNALEVKNEADKEAQELEEQERKWDAPAFLRMRSRPSSKE